MFRTSWFLHWRTLPHTVDTVLLGGKNIVLSKEQDIKRLLFVASHHLNSKDTCFQCNSLKKQQQKDSIDQYQFMFHLNLKAYMRGKYFQQ